ncbi:MAG: tetratricopeptide repeat protein [Flavobacteriaceae bacterium]|nr:tetratricopeptide repeat protein [Flavobacteriaceae bacterium]
MFESNSEELKPSIEKFEQMLKTNHIYFFDAQEFEDIVLHYIGYGQNQLAKKAIKMGLDQHPQDIELLLLQSEMLIIDDKYEAAQALLNYIESLSPLNEEIFLQRATLASKKGIHEIAVDNLNKALNITEDPLEIWNLLGMEYLLAEDYHNAEYFFKNCVLDNSDDYPALYNLLYCYEQLQQKEKAINTLNWILEKNPYNEVAWHQLGRIYARSKNYKEALSAFDFAIISDDTFTGAYIEKGKLLEKTGRLNEAISNYQIALNTNDPSAFLWHRIGNCHLTLGNDNLGIQFLRKAIQLEPSFERAWNKLAGFYIKKKDYRKAKYYVLKGLKSNSDCISLWKKSMIIHRFLTEYEEVIHACQNLIALEHRNLDTWMHYIDGHLYLKEWSLALKVALKALDQFKQNAFIEFRVAGCYYELNQNFKAQFHFQNAKRKKPLSKFVASLFPNFLNKKNLKKLENSEF